MLTRARLLLLAAALTAAAHAQTTNFVARTGAVNLSGAGTTATLQQPKTNAEQIQVTYAKVICPAACTVTQTQNATAVTAGSGTAGSIVALNPSPSTNPFQLQFWTAVTLSGGTVIDADVCSAACEIVVLFPQNAPGSQGYLLGGSGPQFNISLTISSVTGNAYIQFYGVRAGA